MSYLSHNRDYRVHRTDPIKDHSGNTSDQESEEAGQHGKHTVQKQAKPKRSLSARAIQATLCIAQLIGNNLSFKPLLKRFDRQNNFYDSIDK